MGFAREIQKFVFGKKYVQAKDRLKVTKDSIVVNEYPYITKQRRLEDSRIGSVMRDQFLRNKTRVIAHLQSFLMLADPLAKISVAPVPGNPAAPYWDNSAISPMDAISIYGMVATAKPRYYVECGSGNTTKFAAQAIRDFNLQTKILSIDPAPRVEIDALCHEIFRMPFENMDMDFFKTLTAEDVFIVDNSHRAFSNSDVTVFFTETLPILPSGLLYALHDIFLPYDYPKIWIEEEKRHYNEQYMLAVYLLGGAMGDAIELPVNYMAGLPECRDALDALWAAIAPIQYSGRDGGFFWMRRKSLSE